MKDNDEDRNRKTLSFEGSSIRFAEQSSAFRHFSMLLNELIVDNLPGDTVHVEFIGDVAELVCTGCTINGNVNGSVDATTVKCGEIGGNVRGTDIKVSGSVKGYIDGTTINVQGSVGGKISGTTVTVKNK